MSVYFGEITGQNTGNLGLVVGKTVATSTLTLTNTYICVDAVYPNLFSLGTVSGISYNATTTINVTSFTSYTGSNYYSLTATSYNNSVVNITTSNAFTSSARYYSIFYNQPIFN